MREITLIQCLHKLSPLHLKKIAEFYNIVLIPFSSQTARKAILEKFASPDFFGKIMESYSDNHKKALMIIYFYSSSLTAEAINSLIHKTIDEDYLLIMDDLFKAGFVFYIENQEDGRNYYIIPEEPIQTVRKYSLASLSTFYTEHKGETGRIHKPNKSVFLSLMAIIITCINHEIKTNLDKSLNKRLINKIHPIAGLEIELIKYEIIEKYINDLFMFLKTNELIYPMDFDYGVNINRFSHWLNLCEKEKLISLYNFAREHNSDSNFNQFICILAHIPENIFFDISSLANLYRIFFDVNETQFKNFSKEPRNFYYILILYLLGIIEFSSIDVHHYCAWRITDFGSNLIRGKIPLDIESVPENKIIVQPNFELIISRNADLQLLWKIYRFADIFQCDHMLRFNISRQSIYRGLSNNLKADEVTSILEKYAGETMSQNVLYSLKEWCNDFGAVYFIDVFLLRCKNQNLADQIKLNPKTRDFIKGNFSQTDLLVERTDFEPLMEILKSQGLMPLKDIVTFKNMENKNELSNMDIQSKIKKMETQTLLLNLEKIRFLPEIV